MEPNRIWHHPEVVIHSNWTAPRERSIAKGYDVANRRWYALKVEAEIKDRAWLASTLTTYITKHYSEYGEPPPWNTIHLNAQRNLVSFQRRPYEEISWSLQNSFQYVYQRDHKMRTMPFSDLRDLTYINRSTDRCTWDNRDCVFKRIDFDFDVEGVQNEIQIHETLSRYITKHFFPTYHYFRIIASEQIEDYMGRHFCLVPILAVVTATEQPWKDGCVAGILMPYVGEDLETLVQKDKAGLPLSIGHLLAFVRAVQELAKSGVQHGEITYWHTLFQPPGQCCRPGRLMLTNNGSLAPEHYDDSRALGELLLWCLQNAPGLRKNRGTKALVVAAASALFNGNFEDAIKCLSLKNEMVW
ncbi:alpha-L-fucosidase [Pochonia chlamydosporia 170]|uniref:Alpha-L-fucosidase n=1 Tax=Pochonia chlamydosporia 170 TaxID=1380566 RepID=A0A179F7Z7_METCM|nr:alpha-L-fucosidase [Pochonia chlamydosporia 170]OAQ61605.1 alpha-L-fucosidase [Pochonia chlamydosporia 170]